MRYLILALLLSSCGFEKEIKGVALNKKGMADLSADNPLSAKNTFVEALAQKPFDSKIHNNLGVALDASKEIEEGLKSYKAASELAQNDTERFVSLFNLGQGFAKQGKVDQALDWYQKALAIHPDSIEVKTNIELLLAAQSQSGQGQGQQQQKKDQKQKGDNQQDQKDQKDKDEKKDKENDRPYQANKDYKPRPFQGELKEQDVKKILGELKQQEQRIRADYNRKEAKEKPRDKDW